MARAKVVQLAQRAGLRLKQTFEREGRSLRRRAGGYAHAKQFKRLRRVLKRQRTVLGRVLRDVQRRLLAAPQDVRDRLQPWLERAERIRSQRPKDKHKLYALHAPQVECIGKGKARQPYEFGVKVSVAVTAKQGLMVGARSLPGNPYDGHTLAEQLEQTTVLLQDLGVRPHTAIVDLGYRGGGCRHWRGDIDPSRQEPLAHAQPAALAEAASGGRAGHRACQARSRHEALLAQGG